MRPRPKMIAVAAGFSSLFAAAVLAQGQAPGGLVRNAPTRSTDTVVVSGHLDVIERSDVSSLREGVLEKLELNKPGTVVTAGKLLGSLVRKTAELNTAKAEVQAKNTGAIEKGEAQKGQAMADLARFVRLDERQPGSVSREQLDKATADVKFAKAIIKEATENQKVAEAELAIARQIEAEHEIKAPIDGIIVEILKHPGEKVGANEPVVRIVNMDKLRFRGHVPIEVAYRLRKDQVVQVRPTIHDADLSIEQMTFPAQITYIAPRVDTVVTNEIEIYAELDNPKDKDTDEYLLRDGLKADMTIQFGRPANAVGARNAPAEVR